MSWLFHPEVVALGVASLAMLLVLMISFSVGVRYQMSYDRLPAATRLRELEVLVGGEEARLHEVREQLKRSEVALSERDQAEAEAEFWRAAVQTAKAEHEALAEQRREIEETREIYRQALEELTIAETQLRDARARDEEMRARLEAGDEHLRQIAGKEESLRNAQSEMSAAVAALESRLAALREQKTAEAVETERARERRLALQAEGDALDASLVRVKDELARAEAGLGTLREDIIGLSGKRAEIDDARRDLEDLERKRQLLQQSIDQEERQAGRLQARVAKLEEEAQAAGRSGEAIDDSRALADLTKPPACLAIERAGGGFDTVRPRQQRVEEEADALRRVMDHLGECGLEFSARTVNAFHTSLKAAVISPLTVLAGISGTGKSQLPRYYADAMGMHFLKIPVQPRWDSPQDLFGFYNYIEKRYKATDLARALVHLDPHNWPEQAEPFKDRMLLVLLDEMNLARVEYYFSEFLSRLEGRPFDIREAEKGDRRPSEIDIDVAQGGQGKRVYVGQNVLFVGTMNEDESTLALSDKVLDRANVLRFPKPAQLKEALPESSAKYAAQGYLPISRWAGKWARDAEALNRMARDTATAKITRINDVMNELGRPFGHRMGQAMLHYVANYPDARTGGGRGDPVRFALADQIEQRILPRLRGVLVEEHARHLRDLVDVAGRELEDEELGEEMERCIQRSRETNGLFVWRGFVRKA